jgi:hypothetical protein
LTLLVWYVVFATYYLRHELSNQRFKVTGYPADKLDEALDGVQVVVIPAGVPRKVRFYSLFSYLLAQC